METEHRIYEVEAGTTSDIQISLFDMPRMVTINTLISGNIPSSFSTFLRSAEVNNNVEIEEYVRTVNEVVSQRNEEEFIVDNEDDGFSYVSISGQSRLKQYLDARKADSTEVRYDGISPYRIPAKWTPVAHTAFYGESIRSALVSSSGDGGNVARWTSFLPDAGFYDVMVYIPMSAMFSRSYGRGRGGGGPGQESESRQPGQGGQGRPSGGPTFGDKGFDYHYVISSGAGTEEVEFILDNITEGWNRIGSFYFPAGTAVIELSNKTKGKRVFADAVKWVKKPGQLE